MITNDREYAVTKEEAERFSQALATADVETTHLTPRIRRAMIRGMELQLAELREALAHYEADRDSSSSAPTSATREKGRFRSPKVRADLGLAAALKRAGLTLGELATRLTIPTSFAVKLQRGRVDPASLPQQFVVRLGEFLGIAAEDVPPIVGKTSPAPMMGHWRTNQLSGPPRQHSIEGFREALAASPDLTDEHRREWLGEAN